MNKKYEDEIAVEVLDKSEEQKLEVEIAIREKRINSIEVIDNETFEIAGNELRDIKTNIKKVVAFFEPFKTQAQKAHKLLVAKEKETLEPLEKSEKILKSKMSTFVMEKERIRQEQEKEQKRLIEEEKKRAMAEAEKLEKEGRIEEAEEALEQAIEAEEMRCFVNPQADTAKVKGISTFKDYEIVVTDESKVPTHIMGACVRPVDVAAIKKLVKATDGKIVIQGISIKETISMKARTW